MPTKVLDHRDRHDHVGRRSAAGRGNARRKALRGSQGGGGRLRHHCRVGGRQEHHDRSFAEAAFRLADGEDQGRGRRRQGFSVAVATGGDSLPRRRRTSAFRQRTRQDVEKSPPKGHGRNGADAYTGAEKVVVRHESLQPGDPCPKCEEGTVYETGRPGVLVRLVGQAPIQAKVYELQKLRCNLCGEVFTAQAPEGVGAEKYDATAGSMIALLKYGSGMPFNRMEGLQGEPGHSACRPRRSGTSWRRRPNGSSRPSRS